MIFRAIDFYITDHFFFIFRLLDQNHINLEKFKLILIKISKILNVKCIYECHFVESLQ